MKFHISSLRFFLGFLLLSFMPSSMARFVVEKNSLSVISPDQIKGRHDSAIGNFGIPQHGGSIAGFVVYPKDNQKGCREFHKFGITFESKSGALPTIILLDRGDCFFALKVWNAQKAGASAVLADNIKEPLITMYTPEEERSSSAQFIENITIPSALIEKSFGETLKKAISSGYVVNVNLDCGGAVPHPDDRVEHGLLANSNDECGVKCDMLIGSTSESITSKTADEGRSAWTAFWVIVVGLALAVGGAYLAYKYRIREYMDSESEIRAIMAQYMPVDKQAEVPSDMNGGERARNEI